MLVRALAGRGVEFALPENDPFAGDEGNAHETAISRQAAAGVLRGFGDGTVRADAT